MRRKLKHNETGRFEVNPHQELAKSSRMRKAIQVLSKLEGQLLQVAVWTRLTGEETDGGLPSMTRGEEPADIFVDYVAYCDRTGRALAAKHMREACGALIAEHIEIDDFRSNLKVAALGELCYLASRISSKPAIYPLRNLAERCSPSLKLLDDEPLLNLALRALLGLLGHFQQEVKREDFRAVFEHNLMNPRCKMICLTALVGLWPERRDRLIDDLRREGHKIEDRDLSTSLELAGFPESVESTSRLLAKSER